MTDEEALAALKRAGVISDGRIYRMRLFTERERAVLRKGLEDPNSSWKCIDGGSGMMDELEMVRFEVHGKTEIERTV